MKTFITQIKPDNFEYDSNDIKFKYLGIFKERNLRSNSDLLKEEMVSNGVFEEYFCDFFKEKRHRYSESFINEIYLIFKYYAEGAFGDPNTELKNCIYKIKGFVDVKDKIDFLKKRYKEIFPINEVEGFAIYRGNIDHFEIFTNGISNWKELMVDFYFGLCPQIVFLFLTFPYKEEHGLHISDQHGFFVNYIVKHKKTFDEVFFKFLKDWGKYYQKDIALEIITSKIKELEDITTNQAPTKKTTKPPKINVEDKTLEDFLGTEKWSKLYNKLLSEKIIDNNCTIFSPSIPMTIFGIASYIGFCCKNNSINQKNLVAILNNTFKFPEGKPLSESLYSHWKKNHFTKKTLESKDYSDLLHFITKLSLTE
ncbi:hypothetical protein [Mariniflexile sp. HMF6888]|uniref:hypothetical protein n=1 Tax=Mariniflexile sp. HMF6888 TaxID=3373086 RepID=UPI0037B9AA6C